MENDNEEYRFCLYKDLMERCREVVYSTSKKEVIEGLPKIVEVINSIAELENSSLDKVIEKSNARKRKTLVILK